MSNFDHLVGEKEFHDHWAGEVEELNIDPVLTNEGLTSPELRFIHRELGDVKGCRVLDIGCGLGEVSVYFAMRGATVTAVDLSLEMLNVTARLAHRFGLNVRTHQAAAERLGLGLNETFDIVYLGNVFHHVDIGETLGQIVPLIATGGCLVAWDPIIYNPVINVYRLLAANVRTETERPLQCGDVRRIQSYFETTKIEGFWLTTLTVFLWMAIVQKRLPNNVRYWKAVVAESESWRWLYAPLERIDEFLLRQLPALKWLCWNIVVVARKPKLHV